MDNYHLQFSIIMHLLKN